MKKGMIVDARPAVAPPTGGTGGPATQYFKGIATGYWLNQSDTQIQRTITETKAAGCQILSWDVNVGAWARSQTAANFCYAQQMAFMAVYINAHDTTSITNYTNTMVPWLRDRGTHIWEFINEPNGYWGAWGGGVAAPPAEYVTALRTFTTRVKTLDPQATVIMGALSNAAQTPPTQYEPLIWFQGCLAAGLASSDFDAVSVHPYGNVNLSDTYLWGDTWGTAPSIRSELNARGWTTKPIWITECGMSSPWTVPQLQTVITNVYQFMRRTDVGPLGAACVYSAEQSDSYSVLWPGGVANAAAATYAAIVPP